ncbi:MAG TPA: hypothetical protein VF271_10070 [Rhodanobacteraceae bacterium]
MAATGNIVTSPLDAANAVNAMAIPMARAGYAFMQQILGEGATPLIFPSLALSAGAISAGLTAYVTTRTHALDGSWRP